MKTELLPFTNEMIPEAGTLLAGRHTCDRRLLPLLPARFEQAQVATKAVETLWQKKFRNGYAAFLDGRMIAYLIGDTTSQFWARCGYIHLPGYSLAEGISPAILQDLYSLVGEQWNRDGCFNHYIYLSAANAEVIDAWFSLGFGRERADVSQDLRSLQIPALKKPSGFEIRRAGKGDNARLSELSGTIAVHQSRAPRWHPLPPEDLPELKEGWAELADDPEWTVWLAVSGGETLGSIGFRLAPEADDDLTVHPKTTDLTVAAVKEAARGRGVMSALTWHGLEHARNDGYEFCVTNWQTANLLAARTWPRFGFVPVAYRLARTINPMVAWAHG